MFLGRVWFYLLPVCIPAKYIEGQINVTLYVQSGSWWSLRIISEHSVIFGSKPEVFGASSTKMELTNKLHNVSMEDAPKTSVFDPKTTEC